MGVSEEMMFEIGLAGVSGSGIESELRTWIETGGVYADRIYTS